MYEVLYIHVDIKAVTTFNIAGMMRLSTDLKSKIIIGEIKVIKITFVVKQ